MDIVEQLAQMEPFYIYQEYYRICFFCDEVFGTVIKPVESAHTEDCVWLAAKRRVAVD